MIETSSQHELLPLLSRLLELVGLKRQEAQIREVLNEAELVERTSVWRVDADDWVARLGAILDRLGLSCSALRDSLEAMVRTVGIGHPVLIRTRRQGRASLVLLTDRQGSRVQMEVPGEEKRWISMSELQSILTNQEGQDAEWLAVDAALPLQAFSSQVGATESPRGLSPFRRLVSFLKLETNDVLTIMVYSAAIGTLGLATPVAVQALVSTVAFGTVLQPVVVLSALLFVGLAVSAVFRGLQIWVVETLQRRLVARAVTDLAYRLPRARTDLFDKRDGVELVNRFFDVFSIQKLAAELLVDGLDVVLAVLVGLLILGFYHPLLLALDIVLISAVALMVLAPLSRGIDKSVNESDAKYKAAAWLEDVARHSTELKLSGGSELAARRADSLLREYLEARASYFRISFGQRLGALALHAATSAAVLGIGGFLVIERQLTLGQLVAAELVVSAVVAAIAKLGKYIDSFYNLLASIAKVGKLSDIQIERQDGIEPVLGRGARVEARNIACEGARSNHVSNLSFDIAPGKKLAVDGCSDASNTLVLELITGLRDPLEGGIRIDGHDIRDLSLRALRTRVAAVRTIDPLTTSILDNVRFGRSSEISVDAVRQTLRLVDLEDVVDALPEGLETELTAKGTPLSRAQLAKLAVARAIVGQPSLLLIDSVLDFVDRETRTTLIDLIFAPDAPWTAIVVSSSREVHRKAEEVWALERGERFRVEAPEEIGDAATGVLKEGF